MRKRSTTATGRQPRHCRCQAAANPTTPPPITTAPYVSWLTSGAEKSAGEDGRRRPAARGPQLAAAARGRIFVHDEGGLVDHDAVVVAGRVQADQLVRH